LRLVSNARWGTTQVPVALIAGSAGSRRWSAGPGGSP
jgi:hypothetical protein